MISIAEAQALVEKELNDLKLPAGPAGLYEPVRYILEKGGKRIRPALVLIAANLFADSIEHALSPAVGIEIFHNFTLLHDDLMDDAEMRRNRPTVHTRWNTDTAILSGDVMSIIANTYISNVGERVLKQVLDTFNQTAIRVCEGQMMDMEFEDRLDVDEEEYLKMIELKTSVLIAASLKIGALSSEAPAEEADDLYRFGLNLGLAFQLQDDYLDTYGDVKVFGKKIGNDIISNKKTFLMISALNSARGKDLERLKQLVSTPTDNPGNKITEVKKIYDEYGVGEKTRRRINSFFDKAAQNLESLNIVDEKKAPLREFSELLMGRRS